MRFLGFLSMIGLGLGCAITASAEPGLANKVYGPYVKKGVTEVELRYGRLSGGRQDGRQAAVLEVEHGLNDSVSLGVLGEFEDHAGEDPEIEALAIESVVYLGQIPGIGVDVGGYVEYAQRLHGESGVLEGKLLLAKRSGAFEGLLNLIAERPLTDRPGEDRAEFGYAAQATWEVAHDLRLGGQVFGDLGDDHTFGGRQSHYLGPVGQWEIRPAWLNGGELEIEGAFLLPLGAARDETNGQFRLVVEYERKF